MTRKKAEPHLPGGWIRIWHPDQPREVWSRHLPWVVVSGVVLAASALLPYHTVPFRICSFSRWTGHPCPFCGFTRSFAAFTHGNPGWALWNSPLSVLLYLGTWAVFLWNAAALLSGRRMAPGPRLLLNTRGRWAVFLLFGLLLAANWMYRWTAGLN